MVKALTPAERNLIGERMAAVHDFDSRHVHCSNCRNAVVTLAGDGLRVTHCAAGMGRNSWVENGRLIRQSLPYAFKAAKDCPRFTCMTDGCDEHSGNDQTIEQTEPETVA